MNDKLNTEMTTMNQQNDAALVKENRRLRSESVGYLNALESMEIRAKNYEKRCKELERKLAKISKLVSSVLAEE